MKKSSSNNILRLLTKAWLIVVSCFWGFMLLGYAIGGDPYAVEGSELEGIILGILMIFALSSTIYTFRNDALEACF
ncbi:hypothetical protein JW978_03175 [Candidatus Dojkabacteria bacterium]|nr:hypothetical protein [Candidatus Dojkabacteria bacterium]